MIRSVVEDLDADVYLSFGELLTALVDLLNLLDTPLGHLVEAEHPDVHQGCQGAHDLLKNFMELCFYLLIRHVLIVELEEIVALLTTVWTCRCLPLHLKDGLSRLLIMHDEIWTREGVFDIPKAHNYPSVSLPDDMRLGLGVSGLDVTGFSNFVVVGSLLILSNV